MSCAELWLQKTRDQAELEDNQETITHTKVGHFSHSKLVVCVDHSWSILILFKILADDLPRPWESPWESGRNWQGRGAFLQESLARILEEKSRLEKEKEALEAEDVALQIVAQL